MMGLSLPHLIILALVVLVLFGRGRISEMMGDFGKGIKSFKAGMTEEEEVKPMAPAAQIAPPVATAPPPAQPQTASLNGEPIADPNAKSPQA